MYAVFSFLKRKVNIKLSAAIRTVFQSHTVDLPISAITAKIIAIDTIFTASRNELKIFDFLNLGISGFNKATKRKEGRNMPSVAATA